MYSEKMSVDLENSQGSSQDSYRESEDSPGSLEDFIVHSSDEEESDCDYEPSEAEFTDSDDDEDSQKELLAASHLCRLCQMKICGKFEY